MHCPAFQCCFECEAVLDTAHDGSHIFLIYLEDRGLGRAAITAEPAAEPAAAPPAAEGGGEAGGDEEKCVVS